MDKKTIRRLLLKNGKLHPARVLRETKKQIILEFPLCPLFLDKKDLGDYKIIKEVLK